MSTLSGRWCLLTGAAGGLGIAIADRLAAAGANLILSDRDAAGLDAVAGRAAVAEVAVHTVVADLASAEGPAALVAAAHARVGRIDVAILNAGLFQVGAFADADPVEWQRLLQVNLTAPMMITQALVRQWRGRQAGHIVYIASIAGLIGFPSAAAYSASKAGLVGFAEAQRAELAPLGIGVTAVCPAFIRTPMLDALDTPALDLRFDLRRPPAAFCLDAAPVADAVVTAIERDQFLVLPAPLAARGACTTRRLVPRLWQRGVTHLYRWLQSGSPDRQTEHPKEDPPC